MSIALCGGAHAQSNEELKATLDQALKTIQDLQARVETLEHQQTTVQAPAQTAAGAPAAPAPSSWWAPLAVIGTRAEDSLANEAPPATTGTRAEDAALTAAPPAATSARPNADKAQRRDLRPGDAGRDLRLQPHEPDWKRPCGPRRSRSTARRSPGCGKDGASSSACANPASASGLHPDDAGRVKTDLAFDLFGTRRRHPRPLAACLGRARPVLAPARPTRTSWTSMCSRTRSTTGARPAWCSCATRNCVHARTTKE